MELVLCSSGQTELVQAHFSALQAGDWSLRFSAEIAALALSQDSLSVLVGKGGPLQPWRCPGAHPSIGRSQLRLMTVLRMLC